eukprot:357643-Chlamydomonas_euryale.AAC.2
MNGRARAVGAPGPPHPFPPWLSSGLLGFGLDSLAFVRAPWLWSGLLFGPGLAGRPCSGMQGVGLRSLKYCKALKSFSASKYNECRAVHSPCTALGSTWPAPK